MSVERQIMEILNEYSDDLGSETKTAFKETGKDTAQGLRISSREKFKHHGQGKRYADGWTYKLLGVGMNIGVIIYNRTKPGLTHLLENGHMILINGHNYGRTQAVKHIEPAEEKAIIELMEKLSK